MANLGIIGADPSEPPSHEAVLTLANHLLSQFSISTKIESIDDISAALFVILYECLFSSQLPGIIRQPRCKEDEIHNCHVVIDVLATDVVRDNLSHIRAEDIVSGDITAISHLLDIFSYLLEYVINKIDSDVPTDVEDTVSIATTEPDTTDVAPIASKSAQDLKQILYSIATQEKTKVNLASSNKTNNNLTRTGKKMPLLGYKNGEKAPDGFYVNENPTVISHEDFYAMSQGGLSDSFLNRPPSPIKPDHSYSLLGQKSIDSESEKLEKKSQDNEKKPGSPKLAWEDKEEKGVFLQDTLNRHAARGLSSSSVAPAVSSVETTVPQASNAGCRDHLNSLAQETRHIPAFSATLPAPSHKMTKASSDPFRSTVGPIACHSKKAAPENSQERSSRKDLTVKGSYSSYDDLRNLVEKTAALTRVALETSPVRSCMERTQRDLNITDVSEERPRPYISSEGVKLAKELNAFGLHPSSKKKETPLTRNKKVAFEASNLEQSHLDRSEEYCRPSGSISNRDFYQEIRSAYSRGIYDSNNELDHVDKNQDARKSTLVKSKGKTSVKPKTKSSKITNKSSSSTSQKLSLATHLAKNCQSELGVAHVTVKAEGKEMRRKQDILRRMYKEDIGEFIEEVDDILDQDHKKSKESDSFVVFVVAHDAVKPASMETCIHWKHAEEIKYDQYIRRCLEGAPKKKTLKKVKDVLIPSTQKKRKVTSTHCQQNPAANKTKSAESKQQIIVHSEDEILPFLLEEFPHLHLSEHTWHELWRKSLHQIESLTNCYRANERKKTRAQSQLQEAAERHELLANIMKKQLEHTKRMRDITIRKQQQVQVRNKLHEQRMQSARARHYYNEYQVRARGKQLKKKTKEEIVFRELFKDALQIQKERIKDIRQYATDQRKEQAKQQKDEIDSMQNFYHSQFELLSEKLSKERLETEIRDSAQHQMMERLKRELRKKMESEIKLYQDQMFRDDDDTHFRQMDADRIRNQLHLAHYSAQI